MMRGTWGGKLLALLVCSAGLVGVGCGGGSAGTFVSVELRQGTLSQPISSIELNLVFNGQMANRTLTEAGGGVIALPTSAVFKIRNGEGSIMVLASARNAAGDLLAQGTAMGNVVRDDTLGLTITFGEVLVDGGTDGGGGNATLTIDKATQDFGTVVTGMSSAPTSFTITNTGTGTSGTLASTITGTGFSIATNTCATMTLAPAATCNIGVVFSPTTAVAATGMLTVTGAPGGTAGAALTGNGVAPGELSISPPTQDFGMVVMGGNSATTTFTVTNTGGTPTGALAVALSGTDLTQFEVTSDGCDTQVLAGAATCQITLRFSPTSAGSKTASVTVTATPGGTTVASLTGIGLAPGALTMTPAAQDFGMVQQGTPSAAFDFTVTNTGGSTTGTLTTAVSGAHAGDFMISANTCMNSTLLAAGTCTISVRFQPTASGSRSASLTISGTPGGSAASQLTGVGLGPANLVAAPLTHDFGAVTTGSSGTQSITITNTGGVASGVGATSLGGADAGQFSIASDTCGTALSPGGTCTVTVRFSPTTTGAKVGRLSVTASPGGTAMTDLMGSGLAPGALSISPSNQDFGSIVQGGMTGTQNFTVTNTGGSPTGAVTAMLAGAQANQFTLVSDMCSTMVLPAGGTCTISARFNPSTPGFKSVGLQITASPGGTTNANLTGTGLAQASLSVTPTSFTYPSTTVNSTSVTTFTVSNSGGVASGALSSMLGGTHANQFNISTNTCGTNPLAAGGVCTIQVVFQPTSVGVKSASLNISGTPGGTAAATLGGTAISAAAITVTPNPQDWAGVPVGMTADRTLTVTNTGGTASGTVSVSLSGTNANQWSILAPTGTDCVSGSTVLPAAMTCTVRLRFSPTLVGPLSGSLNIAASPGGPASGSLTGTGQQAVLSGSVSANAFGTIEVGATSTPAFVFTVRNTGDATSGVPSVGISGNTGDFISTNTCSAALAPNATCTVSIQFRPSTGGNRAATYTVTASPGGSAAINVTGVGGYRITASKTGGGTGTISSNTGGISCGTTCFAIYPPGTMVTLTSAEAAGSQHMTWGGSCAGAGTATTCMLTVAAAALTAPVTYELRPDTTITRQPPPGATNSGILIWEFTSTIAGSTFDCFVNAVRATCTSPHSVTVTRGSTTTFSVVAIAPTGARDASAAVGTATTSNTNPLMLYEMESNANNTGLMPGFNATFAGATFEAGKFGNAIRFDGSSTAGALITGMGPVFGSTSPGWTISMWFREDSPGKTNSRLLDIRFNTGWETYHGVSTTSITTCSSGNPGCASFTNPSFGVWHNIVWEYDPASYATGAAMNIYLDGVGTPVATINGTTPAILVGSDITAMGLGRDPAVPPTRPSAFFIDRVKVFNVVHTPTTRCTFVIGGTYNSATGNCTLPP